MHTSWTTERTPVLVWSFPKLQESSEASPKKSFLSVHVVWVFNSEHPSFSSPLWACSVPSASVTSAEPHHGVPAAGGQQFSSTHAGNDSGGGAGEGTGLWECTGEPTSCSGTSVSCIRTCFWEEEWWWGGMWAGCGGRTVWNYFQFRISCFPERICTRCLEQVELTHSLMLKYNYKYWNPDGRTLFSVLLRAVDYCIAPQRESWGHVHT